MAGIFALLKGFGTCRPTCSPRFGISPRCSVTKEHAHQIGTAISWFIWKGSIFRVPLSTLQRSPQEGGLGLSNVEAKCRALFISRLQTNAEHEGTLTEAWLQQWNMTKVQRNPLDIRLIPRQYEYLRVYAQEMAYVTPRGLTEGRRTYTKRIYDTLRHMNANAAPPREIRMEHLYPGQDWGKVWKNIAKANITDEARSAWYSVVHDCIPTNVRLHKIRMADNEDCSLCGRRDNLTHRLTECGEGKSIWKWTRSRLARVRQTDAQRISADWITRPAFHTSRQLQHRAALCLIANFILYATAHRHRMNLEDFLDFLRRTRWKDEETNRHTFDRVLGHW